MYQRRKKATRLPGGAIKLRQTVGLRILESVGGHALIGTSIAALSLRALNATEMLLSHLMRVIECALISLP
jgi:predicted acetyltransferase